MHEQILMQRRVHERHEGKRLGGSKPLTAAHLCSFDARLGARALEPLELSRRRSPLLFLLPAQLCVRRKCCWGRNRALSRRRGERLVRFFVRAALGALSQFIGPELLEDVKQALGDGVGACGGKRRCWPDLRRAAALALGEIRAPRARSALLPLLADPHVDVRKAARLALATLAADGPVDGAG